MAFIEKRDEVKDARELRDVKKEQYYTTVEEISILTTQIEVAKTLGNDCSALEAEKSAKVLDEPVHAGEYSSANTAADNRYSELTGLANHSGLVQNLDENYPILLFPVKVETRFVDRGGANNKKLLVRIFPDDIAIETHEALLTVEEGKAGDLYWTRVSNETDEAKKIAHWNDLCTQFGHQRAAWIASNTPTTVNTTYKNHSWTEQPYTRLMPDKFMVVLYDDQDNKVIQYEGASIPDILKVGLNPKDDTTLSNDSGTLSANSEISWMIDFSAAVAKGMGMEIPISDAQYTGGFKKLITVGVKVSSDQNVGKGLIEKIINNHHFTGGISILEQGTSTNNNPEGKSGYSSFEFGNTLSHQIERGTPLLQPYLTTLESEKRDGQVFAEALGISYPAMDHIHRADGRDIQNAKKFGNMSFQAIIGHYFANAGFLWNNYEAIEKTRDFFVHYVSARGVLPSFRVGTQPYGIVPASVVPRMVCRAPDPDKPWVDTARDILVNARSEWTTAVNSVPNAGNGTGDRSQDFLDMSSASPVSQDYQLRVGMGPEVAWNTLNYYGLNPDAQAWYTNQLNFETTVINESGLPFGSDPKITRTTYFPEQMGLHIPFIQASPLSKENPVENMPDGTMNFFEWLSIAPVMDILNENFTLAGATSRPNSMLYEVARYSLLLDYWHAAANYKGLTLEQRKDQELINVDIYESQPSPEAYDFTPALNYFQAENNPPQPYSLNWTRIQNAIALYAANHPETNMQEYITGWPVIHSICQEADVQNPGQIPGYAESALSLEPLFSQFGSYDETHGGVAQPIPYYFNEAVEQWLNVPVRHSHKWELFNEPYTGGMTYAQYLDSTRNNAEVQRKHLDSALDDMEYCKDIPSEDCDLLLREGIDVASDRIDSWELGLITRHLHEKRFDSNGNIIYGSYVGCYGWLENLMRNTTSQSYIHSTNPTEQSAFETEFGQQIKYDSTNNGFLWAPSMNQAITGAILRSGYLQHANADQANMLATNLTSEKIRLAEEVMDGVRNGQDLAALLGYRFERSLHDADGYLDQYIADFRKKYPYPPTAENLPEEERPDSAARNVLDGVKLVAEYRTFIAEYPTENFAATIVSEAPTAINDLIKKLTIVLDAFGDYVVAEGLFMLAQGNPEAANAWMEAFSQGKTPPQGLFSKTPRTGITLTNKVVVKMAPTAVNSGLSWRARVEPNLNAFVSGQLPAFLDIQVGYTYLDTNDLEQTGFLNLTELKYDTLAIQPLDLLLMVNDNLDNDRSELAVLIKEKIISMPSYASLIEIDFDAAELGKKSLRAIFPFLKQLKRVILKSRSLRPADFNNPNTFNTDYNDLYNLTDLSTRVTEIFNAFTDNVVGGLRNTIMTAPIADIDDVLKGPPLKSKLRFVAQFGMANALACVTSQEYVDALNAIKIEYAHKITLLDECSIPTPLPSTVEESEAFIVKMEEIVNIIFSGQIKLLPQFKNPSDSVIGAQIPTNSLLNDYPNNPAEIHIDLMENWIHSVSRVRKPMADLELLTVMCDAVQDDEDTWQFRPFQIPYLGQGNDRWMALKTDPANFQSNVVCYAMLGDDAVIEPNSGGYHAGLFIDSWSETIPVQEETTGIGMHYNSPNAQAPQALLLAVSPTFDGNWSWDDVVDCVNETFEMAKERGVSFKELSSSYIGQLLPAVRLPEIMEPGPIS